jgi:predicted histidine transporter YuiF (NhaC family)
LLWLPACLLFFPLWILLQIVSGRQGDAPQATLDEYEVQQRNSARSIGLTLTQNLMLLPIGYLIIGSTITQNVTAATTVDMADAGGLMALTVLLIGGCTPAMILGWIRPSPDA